MKEQTLEEISHIYKKAESVIPKEPINIKKDVLRTWLRENLENYGGDQYVFSSPDSDAVYYLADCSHLLCYLVLTDQDETRFIEQQLEKFILCIFGFKKIPPQENSAELLKFFDEWKKNINADKYNVPTTKNEMQETLRDIILKTIGIYGLETLSEKMIGNKVSFKYENEEYFIYSPVNIIETKINLQVNMSKGLINDEEF